MIKQYRPYLEELDLTYTQYIAMMVFREEKKLSVKELGKNFGERATLPRRSFFVYILLFPLFLCRQRVLIHGILHLVVVDVGVDLGGV